MSKIIFKDESYAIIGALFDVYNNLGSGFSEIVYKDALEYEFKSRNIQFKREKEFSVNYKDIVLKHTAQCINYLKVSNYKLAILANFHKDLLDHKRIVL